MTCNFERLMHATRYGPSRNPCMVWHVSCRTPACSANPTAYLLQLSVAHSCRAQAPPAAAVDSCAIGMNPGWCGTCAYLQYSLNNTQMAALKASG